MGCSLGARSETSRSDVVCANAKDDRGEGAGLLTAQQTASRDADSLVGHSRYGPVSSLEMVWEGTPCLWPTHYWAVSMAFIDSGHSTRGSTSAGEYFQNFCWKQYQTAVYNTLLLYRNKPYPASGGCRYTLNAIMGLPVRQTLHFCLVCGLVIDRSRRINAS